MLSDFLKFFTYRLSGKCGEKSSLKISPHLKNVTTLPCEILTSKK